MTTKTARDSRRPQNAGFAQMARELPLSDRVAERMQTAIVDGTFKAGERLPSERDLGETFGVSRTVVREAIRSLAAKGMLAARPGHRVHVSAVDTKVVADSLHLYLQGIGGIDYTSVHEVRTILERRIAHLAAERATSEQIDQLRGVMERMRIATDPEAISLEDLTFHRVIAEMTGNPLFPVLLDSIRGVLLEIRRATLSVPGRSAAAIEYHQRILERIVARDPDGAEKVMRDHLLESYHIWETAGLTHRARTGGRNHSRPAQSDAEGSITP